MESASCMQGRSYYMQRKSSILHARMELFLDVAAVPLFPGRGSGRLLFAVLGHRHTAVGSNFHSISTACLCRNVNRSINTVDSGMDHSLICTHLPIGFFLLNRCCSSFCFLCTSSKIISSSFCISSTYIRDVSGLSGTLQLGCEYRDCDSDQDGL